VSVPVFSGYAVSPLWGVGDALTMSIVSGADFSVPFLVFEVDGVTPVEVANPVLEMRRDKSTNAQLMAHFDTHGDGGGLITITGVGVMTLSMDATHTAALPSGRGFWDCFGEVDGQVTLIASGVVVVTPRVTAATVPWVPSTPPTPPIVVDTNPTTIDIAFPAGDDFHLAIALTDEHGNPADLSAATVNAAVTTSTGTVLATFTSTIDASTINLTLAASATYGLPAGARWYCKVTTPADGTETVAAGAVAVSR